MGKTFTDLFRVTECDDGTLYDPIESLLPCQIWEKCKELLEDRFFSPTSDFQLDLRPTDYDEEMKEYPDDAGHLLQDLDIEVTPRDDFELAAPGGSSNDQHCERGQQLVTVTPSPKQQHDGAVEDLSYRGFRGVRWKPGNQYTATLSGRAPSIPAQSQAAHANMQKQNMLLPQLVAHGGRGTVSRAILLPQLVSHGGRGTISGAMAAKASAPAARCLRRLGGVTAARGRLRGY